MKVNEITNAIMKLEFKDLEEVQKTLTYCRDKEFKVGAKVSFLRKKSGKRIYGLIDRINQKSIGVTSEEDGGWKVSKSLLRLEA